MRAMLAFQKVSKAIQGQMILHPMDCEVEKGEFVGIIGPSGSGKSTLLRLVAGLDELSSGEIRMNGRSIKGVLPSERDIAMVFQDYALYPHMSVYDNMAYGLKMRKMRRAEIHSRVEEVGKRLGLTPLLSRQPHLLSGGQQQRVAMGRALVRTPSLYLFDEPLSNLDVSLRAQLRMEIKQLHQTSRITTLYVTHDQMEAMSLATRIMVLNQGQVEQYDTPRNLYSKPKNVFVGTFIGHYPMNLIPGFVNQNHGVVEIHEKLKIPLPRLEVSVGHGSKVLLGIRPEETVVEFDDGFSGEGLSVNEVFVDDMGADVMVRMQSELTADPLMVRLPMAKKKSRKVRAISFESLHAHLFLADSGCRIGGWDA